MHKCGFIMQSLFTTVMISKSKPRPDVRDTYRASRMNRTLFDVVNKRNMIRRMPVQRIEHRVKIHGVDQFVDWVDHL